MRRPGPGRPGKIPGSRCPRRRRWMFTGIARVPPPVNEPVHEYAPGSAERAALVRALDEAAGEVAEIPCVIGGRHVFTGKTIPVTMPCEHEHVLARLHVAGPKEIATAVDAAESARAEWAALPWEERTAVLLRASSLLAGPR